jgi:hypothetical protein
MKNFHRTIEERILRGVLLAGFVPFIVDDSSDRGGARTHDQRINVPHRLSPTSRRFQNRSGRCKSGLSHRRFRRAASSLWGWGRRSVGPLPADYPIPRAFPAVTLAVTGCVVASGALRAFQQIAACSLRGSDSSRGGLLFSTLQAVVEVRCSTD